jgi:hypothetical protein
MTHPPAAPIRPSRSARAGRGWPIVALAGGMLAIVAPAAAFAQSAGNPTAQDSGDAPAQVDQAPISLFPPPGQAEPATPAPDQDSGPQRPPSVVAVQPLAAPAADSVGLLTPDQGGFGADLWRATTRARVAVLLPLLPAGTGSPAADALAYRLLASQATAPEGEAPEGKTDRQSLLALRLERLSATALTTAVLLLLDRAGRAGQGPDFAAIHADAALLEDKVDDACAIAEVMRKTDGSAPWLELSAFCAARRNDSAAVQVDLGLLEESNAKVERTFLDLLQAQPVPEPAPASTDKAKAARTKKTTPAKIAPPSALTPLLYAMYRAAGVAPPEAVAMKAPLPVLRAVVGDDRATAALRLDAAERCAVAGAVQPSVLAQLYAAAKFDDTQMSDPVKAAAKLPPALGNALLFQAIGRSGDTAAKQAMLHAALARAHDQGRYLLAARVYAPGVAAMTPNAGQIGFARDAARVLLAADMPDQAFAWYVLVQHAAQDGDADAKAARQALWPAFALSQPQSRFPVQPQEIVDWAHDAPEAKGRNAIMVLTLLEALGRPVPDGAWWPIYARQEQAQPMPANLPLARLVQAAAAGGRVGETVLESLILIGPDIARTPAADLAAAVDALRAVDQDAAARGIARDAALVSSD